MTRRGLKTMANDMPVDSEGRVYAATNSGVEVFSPDGELLGSIAIQWGADNNRIRKPQNAALGGPGRKTLHMAGAGSIFKVRTPSEGPQRPTKQGSRVIVRHPPYLGSSVRFAGSDRKPLHSETSYIVGTGTVPGYRCDHRVQGMGATTRRSHSKGAVGS
jgi:hypothetical protein